MRLTFYSKLVMIAALFAANNEQTMVTATNLGNIVNHTDNVFDAHLQAQELPQVQGKSRSF